MHILCLICGGVLIQLCIHMKQPTIVREPLVTGNEVAAHFTVDPHTVRRWRYDGCPFESYGLKMIRYRLSEVEAWLQKRTRKGA
jgi:helix-turn-helix protein